jgi:MFS transporter, DHA3 family, macrolide efflux protein
MMDRRIRIFLLIWVAHLISMFGSGLTGFAMGVWIYQRTGSVTQFAFTVLSMIVPGILVSPVAGLLVDRWNRRWVMILSDSGSALSVLAISLLLMLGRFEVWHFYIALAMGSVFGVFRELAFAAIIPMLVPRQHFGRVSGLMQMGFPATRIFCPLVAALLLGFTQIQSVILIDFCTFFAPIVTMLLVRIPRLKASVEGRADRGSFWQGITSGWIFITSRRGVLVMLLFFVVLNFTMGLSHALYGPLLLSFTSVKMVGLMSTIGACGLVFGSLVMGVWGGPKRRIRGIFIVALIYGAGLITAGLRESIPLIAVAFFVSIFGVPIITGSMQAMWLSKTPPDLQGRVFAVWTMILKGSLPLAYLVSGPLADQLFRPLLEVGGPLAGNIGELIGVGPGRGIGLLYIAIGFLVVLATTVTYLHPRFRLLEDELPDVIGIETTANMERSYA